MEIKEDSILNFINENYIVLNVIQYNGISYGITNKLDADNEPIDEMYIFKNDIYGNLEMVSDSKVMNKLLPIFQKNLEDMIHNIIDIEGGIK